MDSEDTFFPRRRTLLRLH